MPEIVQIRPEQAAEARQVIYQVAYWVFHDRDSLEEAIELYKKDWPLQDLDDIQSSYLDNRGTFLVTLDGERIVGTGALCPLEGDVGEIKRIWLLPEYHGRGLGYQMMLRLLDVAVEKGYKQVRLQTSPKYQPRAYAFYRKMGFYEVPRWDEDPDEVGLELSLE